MMLGIACGVAIPVGVLGEDAKVSETADQLRALHKYKSEFQPAEWSLDVRLEEASRQLQLTQLALMWRLGVAYGVGYRSVDIDDTFIKGTSGKINTFATQGNGLK